MIDSPLLPNPSQIRVLTKYWRAGRVTNWMVITAKFELINPQIATEIVNIKPTQTNIIKQQESDKLFDIYLGTFLSSPVQYAP